MICYCENVLLQIAACPHYITNTVHCTQSHHHFLDLLCSPSTVAHAVSAAQTRFSPASLRFPAPCPLFIKVQISSSIHLYNATEKINDKSKCPYYMNARKKNNERRKKAQDNRTCINLCFILHGCSSLFSPTWSRWVQSSALLSQKTIRKFPFLFSALIKSKLIWASSQTWGNWLIAPSLSHLHIQFVVHNEKLTTTKYNCNLWATSIKANIVHVYFC